LHYASVESLSKSFGVRKLFSDITFHISEGDKIALIARNGFGKSTLLKILNGQDHADSGEVWVHKDIRIVMLEQENDFKPESEVWDHMMQMNHEVIRTVKAYDELMELSEQNPDTLQHLLSRMDELQAWNLEHLIKQILSKLNITQLHQKMGSLSGGQKKRVALAQALIEAELYSGKCLLIMDEPTNHLDMSSVKMLVQAINQFEGTVVLVSHDRYFIQETARQIWQIEDGEIKIFNGTYNEWERFKNEKTPVAQPEAAPKVVEVQPEAPKQNTSAFKEKQKEEKKLRSRFTKLEEEIQQLEKNKAELENKLAAPDTYANKVLFQETEQAYQAVILKLSPKQAEYEVLFEELLRFEEN